MRVAQATSRWRPRPPIALAPHGSFTIELLNAADPSHAVEVVVTDELTYVTYPLWSPDGQTLVVLDVSSFPIVPYAIDVDRYLRSKGLEQ